MDDIQAPNTTTTTTQAITIPEWKRVLPAPLNNKTKTLQRIIVPGPDGSTVQVYLLGTAHVSMDSSKDVQLLLDCIQPNVIFLELCDQRIGMLLTTPPKSNNTTTTTTTSTITDDEEQQEPPTGKKRWWQRHNDNKKKTAAAPKQPKSLYATAASLLTNMQQDYADSLNVELGGEFSCSYFFSNFLFTSVAQHYFFFVPCLCFR